MYSKRQENEKNHKDLKIFGTTYSVIEFISVKTAKNGTIDGSSKNMTVV